MKDSSLVRNFCWNRFEKFSFSKIRTLLRDLPKGEHQNTTYLSFYLETNVWQSRGILRGDLIIFRFETKLSSVRKDALCVCLSARGEKILKLARNIRPAEIFFGVVVRVERDF